MSWKPEVKTPGSGWAGNATRFATHTEAEQYVFDLRMRWTAVQDTRVVESDDPVVCAWKDGILVWKLDR